MCNNNYLEVIILLSLFYICLPLLLSFFLGIGLKKYIYIFLYTEAQKSKLEFNVVNTYIRACGHVSLCIAVAQFFFAIKIFIPVYCLFSFVSDYGKMYQKHLRINKNKFRMV